MFKNFMKAVVFTAFSLSVINTSLAQTSSHEEEVNKSLVETVENSFTGLAHDTLVAFRTKIPITIGVKLQIKDSAETSRYYTIPETTLKCTVNINPDYYIYSTSRTNPMTEAGFTEQNVREFIYMHELAHCFENELAPKGIDEFAWRETLAEGYAAYMAISHGLVYRRNLANFAKFRRKYNQDQGAFNVLEDIIKNEDIVINADPLFAMQEMYKIRKKIFATQLK